MWCLSATIMTVMSRFCSTVRLRLLTTVSVSCDKHRVNNCTLVSVDLLTSPKRVEYDVHWAFHASKSTPQSTWMSSLGISVCRKTNGIFTRYFVSTSMNGNDQVYSKVHVTLTGASTSTGICWVTWCVGQFSFTVVLLMAPCATGVYTINSNVIANQLLPIHAVTLIAFVTCVCGVSQFLQPTSSFCLVLYFLHLVSSMSTTCVFVCVSVPKALINIQVKWTWNVTTGLNGSWSEWV